MEKVKEIAAKHREKVKSEEKGKESIKIVRQFNFHHQLLWIFY